ncbi:MAG: hypothetical protein NT001_01185 [Candidatus Woesearchaeota archaeon]|nr:hypothetical protein [Candidatus Woesearchaeota archaeon]
MADEREVKTDVDRLLSLVKEKKELSFDEAAKQLGMPAKTVEAISDLLEEEGMLHIKYKFTTPYLTSESPSEKAKNAQKEPDSSQELVIEKESALKMPLPEKPKVEVRQVEPLQQASASSIQNIHSSEPLKNMGIEIPETTDIDELIKLANDAISKGDFDMAKLVYLRIKALKEDLPNRFLEEDKKVKGGLADLNDGIVIGMDQALQSDFDRKSGQAEMLFGKIDDRLKAGNTKTINGINEIERMYNSIKDIYFSLPGGFMDRKIEMQDRMLEIYRTIISNKKSLLAEDFSSKSAEIEQQIGLLASKIQERNVSDANKVFHSLTQMYKNLPAGFLKEKTAIQNRILSVYQQLILNRENIYSNEIKAKADEIKALLLQTMNLVNMNDLKRAEQVYNRMTEIYSKLPEGYYNIRTDIEMKMFDIYHLLSLKKSKAAVTELDSKVDEIEFLAKSVSNYINNREFDLAKESYHELITLYNSLPEGFLGTSLKIRSKITKLYKDLLSFETAPMIGEADKETVKAYSELLLLLVQIHDHIKKKEFGKIKDKYFIAYKLYHELPLSFIEKKTSIYKEVYKIYEELKAYSEVAKLPAYAEKGDYGRLKDSLNMIIDMHGRLVNRYPEDMELSRFIHGQCLIYLDVLKGRRPETGKQVRDKIENIVEQKKNSTIEKTPELIRRHEKQSSPIDMSQESNAVMPGVHPVSAVHQTIAPQAIKREIFEAPRSRDEQDERYEPGIVSANAYLKKKYGIVKS